VRILIVDDDHVSLLAMARPLRKAGYDVVEAMRAEQIVGDAEDGRYDVIVMSIFMPGMGGISAIERIHKKDPTCKIVAVTAGYANMSAENVITAAKKNRRCCRLLETRRCKRLNGHGQRLGCALICDV
tara:strand:+ start:337 stop:720 length:384 start_codon:yes stop_codon:yes gene_type:complete